MGIKDKLYSFLNASNLFIIFVIIAAFFGYYLITRFKVTPLKRFQLIVSYLGSLSVFLVTMNLYLNMRFNQRVEENRSAYNTLGNIQRIYIDPQKELLDKFPEGYFLYASMTPDVDLSALEPEEYNQAKRMQVEVYMALKVFQLIEDFLSTNSYSIRGEHVLTGSYVWINNFLMWLQSPILQQLWKYLGFNNRADTRAIITAMIEQANDLVDLRKKKGYLDFSDYDTASKEFLKHTY